jgi:hypothetical protein
MPSNDMWYNEVDKDWDILTKESGVPVLKDTGCIVRDSMIILIGGYLWSNESQRFTPNSQTWLFNTKTKSWKPGAGNKAVQNIIKPIAVNLGNNQTLIFGGMNIEDPDAHKPNN